MTTRAARELSDDALCESKCKAQAESHEAVDASVAASKLVADQGFMIYKCSTPKDSKMNTTCCTNKPQSFQTYNSLENSSQSFEEPNHFSQSNLATQLGNDKVEESGEITSHHLSTPMGNAANISLIYSSSGYFVDVK